MTFKNKKSLFAAICILCSLFISSGVSLAAVDCTSNSLTTQQAIECGTNSASTNPQTPEKAATNINHTVSSTVNILSLVAGTAAVIMIIVGGLRYVTSGGSQEAAKSAKNTLLYAVIGLVVVAVAQIIVHFVISQTP